MENMDQQQDTVTQTETPEMKESNTGPSIAIIIILIMIILGGIYFWIGRSENVQAPTQEVTEFTEVENTLNTPEFDAIDAELNKIDAEFDVVI